MTRGAVLLGLRHARALIVGHREAREHVRGVRDQLRSLGIHGLADQLTLGLQALGRAGELNRAIEAAAERGGTVDDELRRLAVARQQRRGREVA